jgi:DNA-binding transcriptional MerR regulator
MIISKEADEMDFIVFPRKLTERDDAEFSKALAEHRALRDSLRAQGYSEEEVQARLNSRFAGEMEGVEQITATEYLARMDTLIAKGYSLKETYKIIDSKSADEIASLKKPRRAKLAAATSAKRRKRRDSAVLTA